MTDRLPTIGIPYARVDFDEHGAPVEVCPDCGLLCPMRVDEYGEMTLGTYGDHYMRTHEAWCDVCGDRFGGAERVEVNGHTVHVECVSDAR